MNCLWDLIFFCYFFQVNIFNINIFFWEKIEIRMLFDFDFIYNELNCYNECMVILDFGKIFYY